MNFIVYGGLLRSRVRDDATPARAGWRETERHRTLFEDGLAICGLNRPGADESFGSSQGDKRRNREFLFYRVA
jgi:hypothetical protein